MIPRHWQSKPLEDVAKFMSGGTPSKKEISYWNGDFPWVSAKDMKAFRIADTHLKLSDSGRQVSKIAPEGSILILIRGMTLLKDLPVCYADKEFSFNQDVKALIPTSELSGYFLGYLLQGNKNKILQLVDIAGHGTGRIDTNTLKEYCVNIPPVEEQKKIVDILEAWDDAIATTEKLIIANQKLKSALVQKLMYGVRKELYSNWKLVRFGEIVSQYIDYRGKTPLKIGLSWGDGFIKALSANNVQVGYIDFSRECKLGSETLYDTWMKHGDCEKGDVLLTMEAPLGNVAQIPDNEKYILSQRVVLIKPKTEVVSKNFLALFMATPYFQHELLRNSSGTTAIGIQRKRLDKIKFRLPPTKEQKRIADVLSTINKTIYVHQEKLILLKKQKKGLMQKILTGEWPVKVKEAA